MNYKHVLSNLNSDVSGYMERRRWYNREALKRMPYKAKNKTDADKRRRRYRKEIQSINNILKEYRSAIKILEKNEKK